MSVRVTRKTRRVVDWLSRGPATIRDISENTNIKFPALWPIMDRLTVAGWIVCKSTQEYVLTEDGRAGRKQAIADEKQAHVQSWPEPRIRGPRPPWTQRRTPFNRGTGRSR
jgi:hypothetical protein